MFDNKKKPPQLIQSKKTENNSPNKNKTSTKSRWGWFALFCVLAIIFAALAIYCFPITGIGAIGWGIGKAATSFIASGAAGAVIGGITTFFSWLFNKCCCSNDSRADLTQKIAPPLEGSKINGIQRNPEQDRINNELEQKFKENQSKQPPTHKKIILDLNFNQSNINQPPPPSKEKTPQPHKNLPHNLQEYEKKNPKLFIPKTPKSNNNGLTNKILPSPPEHNIGNYKMLVPKTNHSERDNLLKRFTLPEPQITTPNNTNTHNNSQKTLTPPTDTTTNRHTFSQGIN